MSSDAAGRHQVEEQAICYLRRHKSLLQPELTAQQPRLTTKTIRLSSRPRRYVRVASKIICWFCSYSLAFSFNVSIYRMVHFPVNILLFSLSALEFTARSWDLDS